MKLKQKLQNLIEMKKPNDTLLNEIANLKTKLVSAPSIDYETYSKLSDIENSVYRYNNFLRNGMQSNADNEAKKLMNFSEDEDITLQGGISNTKYIWRTEPKACKECQELDNTEYNNKEDIPEKTHPNCKCYVEEEKDDEEACEYCVSALEDFENVLQEAQSVLDDGYNVLNGFISFASGQISLIAYEKINDVIDSLSQIIGAFQDFISNYFELLELNKEKYHEGSPEFYHQKANCQATQRGELGEATSVVLGQIREFTDYYKDIYVKGKTIEEAEYNNEYDFAQNAQGRRVGKENPDGNCEEILKGRINVDWSTDF